MRYKCICTYDGTLFHGFQVQSNSRTVQKDIEKVIFKIIKVKTNIYSSGRTDAGVHAFGQVFHFDSDIELSEGDMKNALNSILPRDIYITDVEKVDESFHSRYDAKAKEYHYLIDFGAYDPLKRNYRYYCFYKDVNISIFEKAMKMYIGVHDFRAFTKNKKILNTVREITTIEFDIDEQLLTIKIKGNGFMHNMVRILVAMALEVGRGKLSLEDLKSILERKNSIFSPKIAPSSGLYLYKVYY